MLCVSYAAWDDKAPNHPSITVEVDGSVSVVHDRDVLNMGHWGTVSNGASKTVK